MLAPPERAPGHSDEGLSAQLDAVLPALAQGRPVQHAARRVVLASVGEIQSSQTLAADVTKTCALRGYRTLAIDANLHEPLLHRIFAGDNVRGLSNLLSSNVEAPHRLIQPTGIANLSLLPAGPPLPNGSSLLSSEDVFHRVEPVAYRFDFVVLDASRLPPVLVATLAEHADSIVLFTRRHVTPVARLARFVELMRAKHTVQPSVLLLD